MIAATRPTTETIARRDVVFLAFMCGVCIGVALLYGFISLLGSLR